MLGGYDRNGWKAVIAALGLPSSVYRVRSAMVSEFSIDGGFDLFGERHPVAPN